MRDPEQSERETTDLRLLKQPGITKLLILGIVLAVFQQWCGINVIFNYAQEIFANAGYSVSDTLFNIVITGSVNLIFTFVGMFTVDRLGRKALMLIGAGGLACHLCSSWNNVLFSFAGIAIAHNGGCCNCLFCNDTWTGNLGDPFRDLPEPGSGVLAMSVATFALWAACFVLTYTFPLLNKLLKASGTFWLYGFICVLGFWFILKKLPETKGKSLEEIEHDNGEGYIMYYRR